MPLDPVLLEILACPEDKGPLLYFESEDALYNPRLRRRYAIKDDIPVMLIDEAETVDDAEHDRLLAKAEAEGIEPTFDPGIMNVAEGGHKRAGGGVGARMTVATDPTRRGIDTQGMFDATAALPEQVEAAIEAGTTVEGLPDGEGIANIVVLGMGGSGVAGDLLAALGQQFLPVPVVVAQGYDAPSFIDPTTLVFALSFSGNTEETLQAADEAQTSGARIVAVSRPEGQLAERALEWGAPHIPIPDGIPQPRAGLGALAIPPLVVLERLGLFAGAEEWARAAVTQLRRRRDQLVPDANPAAELARRIGRSLPIIYGASATGAVAATRWKTQVNENAKVPAFANAMPELCHNEICGWGQHGDLTRQVFQLVLLRHDDEHPQDTRRFELVAGVMEEVVGAIHTVQAEGDGSLAQVLDLTLFGDFVSLHLAAQEGLDPGPVPILDEIKAALSHG